MKLTLSNLFCRLRASVEAGIDPKKYPKCFPLPSLSSDDVWKNMNWGTDFKPDNAVGAVGGAAVGAAAGSFIPVVGTALGALAGFCVGMARDISKDEGDRKAFQHSAVSNTINAYLGEPSLIVKSKICSFREEVLRQMQSSFEDKKNALIGSFDRDNRILLNQQIKLLVCIRFVDEINHW